MPNFKPYTHHRKTLPDGSGRYDIYRPAAEETSPPFLISTGLFGQPSDYYGLARDLSRRGAAAIVTDTTIPLRGEKSSDPLEVRAHVLREIIEAEAREFGKFILAGHSFGGAYQLGVLEDSGEYISSIDFISAAGFAPIRNIGGMMIFIRDEMSVEASKIITENFQHPTMIWRRLRAAARLSDVRAVLALAEGHNIPSIRVAKAAGIGCRVFVAPGDNLVPPQPTIRLVQDVVEPQNIIEIHPAANHLTPKHSPRMLARALLGQAEALAA